jgi:hypothetical protein
MLKTCPQVADLPDDLSSDEEPFNPGRISFTVVEAEMDDVVDDDDDDSDYCKSVELRSLYWTRLSNACI